jgi:hypothetical protein
VVTQYLTIPEVTDAEDIVSFSQGSSHLEFNVVINTGHTAVWLFQAAALGTVIPLVVIMADAMTIALDDAVVSASLGSAVGDAEPHVAFTFNAAAIRYL